MDFMGVWWGIERSTSDSWNIILRWLTLIGIIGTLSGIWWLKREHEMENQLRIGDLLNEWEVTWGFNQWIENFTLKKSSKLGLKWASHVLSIGYGDLSNKFKSLLAVIVQIPIENSIEIIDLDEIVCVNGRGDRMGNWLVVTGTMEFYDFPFSWECHHPNWRSHIFRRGRAQPPTR